MHTPAASTALKAVIVFFCLASTGEAAETTAIAPTQNESAGTNPVDVSQGMPINDLQRDLARAGVTNQPMHDPSAELEKIFPCDNPTGSSVLGSPSAAQAISAMLLGVSRASYQDNRDAGFMEDEGWSTGLGGKESASKWGGSVGSNWNGKIAPDQKANPNCKQQFINDKGDRGPWGRVVQEEMKKAGFNSVYNRQDFADSWKLCPGYSKFNDTEREAFWVGFFGSLAQPESSCNPRVENRAADVPAMKNGQGAIGLYQLEPDKCDGMSDETLKIPERNIACAVRKFTREMNCRETVMQSYSNGGSCGTYWGPLRSKTGSANDSKGARTFVGLMNNLPGCR